ncbi:tRNA pseudouridine(38-40) synthase TruA [Fundidesulfovibrio butyratiphilus]
MAESTFRLLMVVAYQGTDFAGWQYQPEGQGRSVQACLEAALSKVAGRPVRAHGASRTDSGVHALHQVAHADLPLSRASVPWTKALNTLLPRDMAVVLTRRTPDDFHLRRAVACKTYAYTLWHAPDFTLPQRRPFVWAVGPLDFLAMEAAAAHLVGRHDFAAFQNTGTRVASTVRTVDSLIRHPGQTTFESVWRVRGHGFLKQMVRNIMGALVWVGRGKAEPDFVRSLLLTRDRTLAPATAPARGLCLEHMEIEGLGRLSAERHPDGEDPERDPGQTGLRGQGGSAPGAHRQE